MGDEREVSRDFGDALRVKAAGREGLRIEDLMGREGGEDPVPERTDEEEGRE